MEVWLNDKATELDSVATLEEALNSLDYKNGSFAVAVNSEFVPRTLYGKITLTPGDKIDIVTPMQGG